MNWLWISGWGVSPEWFERFVVSRFPHAHHRVVPPDPDGEWRTGRSRFDRLTGYSLGAFLLMREELRAPSGRPVGLLAPFFGFPAEAALGGRVPLTRLRYLRRWMNRDPASALRDFHQRAGLTDPADRAEPVARRDGEPAGLPYGPGLLEKGLDVLIDDALAPGIPAGAVAVAGERDPLLDSERMLVLCPGLTLVPGAGHHPAPLIETLAREWQKE